MCDSGQTNKFPMKSLVQSDRQIPSSKLQISERTISFQTLAQHFVIADVIPELMCLPTAISICMPFYIGIHVFKTKEILRCR